eukprot:Plantae.Rhodophyta-Purpureofilum_apyrenoidigerum.ctg25183.p1 GENE.Plantae.Rhodophyta-Purpureofilum_apyrenoidigerum.ctg25183~~Plantae.Rhodophyta-Purpureofilum_apyrenoidigerum.ctg25183.p1  ORF type:complete len:343 (+),score=49.76 Plantae.Rhodophyta-Purpureofilum_apyrenoidigerum.ctg25183:49-1029(+)
MVGAEARDVIPADASAILAPSAAVISEGNVQHQTAAGANMMYFWSLADDLVVTLALLGLIRTLFYITRGRTGRTVRREAAAVLLKFWCSFMAIRMALELFDDFMPGIVHVPAYQVLKVLLFAGMTVLRTTLAEKFFDKFLAVRFDERAPEIHQLSKEWQNFTMVAMESLIDHLEYLVNWLKRRYIMRGGNMSLQPRQIVLSDEQQATGRDSTEEGGSTEVDARQSGRRRLTSSMSSHGPTFFSGGSGFSASSRSLSQRMQALAESRDERDAKAELKRRGSMSTDDVRVNGARLPGQKSVNPYEKIKSLRKQMREGGFKKSAEDRSK